MAARPHQIFSALGDQGRLRILRLLREGPKPVAEITAGLTVSRPAVSRHLRLLREAGLVRVTPKGTKNFYALNGKGFQTAAAELDFMWDVALEKFRQFAEQEGGKNGDDDG